MFLPIGDDTPWQRLPRVTLTLALACTLASLPALLSDLPERTSFIRSTGMIPWEICHLEDLTGGGHVRALVPPPLTVLTSLFVHGSLPHLLGNLWFLWIFGGKLEGYLGARRYLGLLLGCGVVGAVLQAVTSPDATAPVIGASGAAAGMLGAHAASFRGARVRCFATLWCFVTRVELPALFLLGLWFLTQVAAARAGAEHVAWMAHAGGLGLGVLAGPPLLRHALRPRLRRRSRQGASWTRVGRSLRRRLALSRSPALVYHPPP